MRRSSFLRVRFRVHFRTDGPVNWNPFVAEMVRLPSWGYEAHEQGKLIFVRAEERAAGADALARLYLDPGGRGVAPSAEVEVALRGRWTDEDEQHPPLGAVQHLVAEAEALLVLFGGIAPKARFEEAYRTRK